MPQLPSDTQLYLVNDIDTAFAMKRWLGERREVLGLDTETSGLDPYEPGAKLRTIQIGDHKTGWCVPWELWGGVALECLNAYEGRIALHNVAFDSRWLSMHAGWKVPWHRTDDTMIMAQIERPGAPADLKGLSVELVDPRANGDQKELKDAMKKSGWGWHNIPVDFETYWTYSALDPVLTAHLWSAFRTDLKYPDVFHLEMAVRRICTQMEDNGMRVDLDYSKAKYDELMQYVETSKKWAKDNWGIAIGSNVQLANFFQNDLNATFKIFSKTTGKPSVDKNQLDIFQKSDNKVVKDVADFIIRVRNAEKMGNSYFKNFLGMNNDGIVHPTIRTMGARTHRMSITSPALQTIPRGEALVRDAFIPVREGEGIISCDYSQVEMRLLAHFSGDEKLQGAFKEADATGGDFFVGLGKDIYNDDNFSKKDPRRGLVKSTMYGAAYGSGIKKMAETAGVTMEQMEAVANGVFKTYPGIKRFMAEIEAIGTRRERLEGQGYVLTGMGRRLPADEGKVYTLTNYILQGTAAELMKKAIVRLDAAGYTPYMCVPIHDEMVLSLPLEDQVEAMHDIGKIMSYMGGEFAVDLPAEPEGPFDRWGSKYRKKGEVFGYTVA